MTEQKSRAVEVQATRRRRQNTGETSGMKLFVPEEAKDPNFTYRWFNDEPGRIHQKTKLNDWDLVNLNNLNGYGEAEKQAEGGTRVSRFGEKGASGAGGQPRKTFLARKRKEYYEADRREVADRLAAKEEELRRSGPPVPQGISGSVAYVPGGKNVVNGR